MFFLLLWKGPSWCWHIATTTINFLRAVVTIQMLVIIPLVVLMLIAPYLLPDSSSINPFRRGRVGQTDVQHAKDTPQSGYLLETGALLYDFTPE